MEIFIWVDIFLLKIYDSKRSQVNVICDNNNGFTAAVYGVNAIVLSIVNKAIVAAIVRNTEVAMNY